MAQQDYDYIIVGSGTGGSVLARELSLRGKQLLVIEGGRREVHVGTPRDCERYYDGNKITRTPKKASEGTILWRTFMVGGSSVVCLGNGVRSLEKEFREMGINLETELREAEDYTHVAPIDERMLSEGSQAIREAAGELGYRFDLTPKMIDLAKCHKDHRCGMGCRYHAHWTGEDACDEALQNGASLMTDTWIDHILVENGKVIGLVGKSPDGVLTLRARTVILAAGGLGTPVILQRSGIAEAGTNLFIDAYINVYGTTRELNLVHEPAMSLVDLEFHKEEGFLLSPYVVLARQGRLIEAGLKGSLMSANKMLGIMVKTRDDDTGRVFTNGAVSKPITPSDRRRLSRGQKIAAEILIKTGVDPKSIIATVPQGAHPGGTAGVGRVVDNHLQTRIEGLFVCDASVLPTAPGLPPIITIIALAKWLSKRLP
jgi:choline dehydrogenase-like flavoprotein